jgi:uncharacterized protein YkwD
MNEMTRRRILLLGMTGLPLGIASRLAAAPGWPESFTSMEHRIFEAVNAQRANYSVPALVWDDMLSRTARAHSRRMLDANFFGHVDPEFGNVATRLTEAGVAWGMCAENVFREKNYPDPVPIAIVDWMKSEGHRKNILSPEYTASGVGMATGDDGTVTITQQFLTPVPKIVHRRQ